MPALTAHYKLSEIVSGTASPEIKSIISGNISMYTLGAQGPDMLFYYKPLKRNYVNDEGSRLHAMAGREFFGAFTQTRDDWTPGFTAYMLGVCCHYALDRNCHPYVYEVAPTTFTHQKLEAEFDLFIINTFGIDTPRYKFIPDTGVNPADLPYKNIETNVLAQTVKSFRKDYKHLMHRRFVTFIDKLAHMNGYLYSLCLPKTVTSATEMKRLFELFNVAVEDAGNLMQLLLHGTSEEIFMVMHNNFKGASV